MSDINDPCIKKAMTIALNEAQSQRGFCAPNPSVGAVIIKEGSIIAQGHHNGPGTPHAEVSAIRMAGEASKGATMVVTLEPCCHTGRTPPCTNAIQAAGIAEVFFGFYDPHDVVAGKGQGTLNVAGIPCHHAPLDAVTDFYRSYHHWTVYGRPWVSAKLALTAEGGVASSSGAPIIITGESANQRTHYARFHSDAVLTSIATVLADDPQLNARVSGHCTAKPVIVIDPLAELPLRAHVWNSAESIVVFHGPRALSNNVHRLQAQGARCLSLPLDGRGQFDLNDLIRAMGELGFHDVWVEVGPRLFKALQANHCVDETLLYISPHSSKDTLLANLSVVTGSGDRFHGDWEQVGEDSLWHHRRH
ncbi:MAG: riboflavin biosynthesis protein RibD [Coxiellaceae bacterium]|nr:riboflavin biosynthesis protein RibD [Coxiellaceae bacterium]